LLAFGAVQKIAPAVGSQMADNMRSGQVLMDKAGVPVLDSLLGGICNLALLWFGFVTQVYFAFIILYFIPDF
jgi:hypothetical protein